MEPGARVRLQGLQGRTELNGEEAILVSFNMEKKRWVCRVVSSGVTLSLPEACAVPLRAATGKCEAEWDIALAVISKLVSQGGPETVCLIALTLASVLGFLGPVQLLPLEQAGSALPFDRAALEQASRTASGAFLLSFGWMCVITHVLWHALPNSFMRKNFTLSANNLKHGRYWNLLSCEISHSDLPHLLANMAGLLAATPGLASSEPFWGVAGLIVMSAAFSSVTSVYGWRAVTEETQVTSLGASGVIFGLMTADAIRSPANEVVLFGVTMSSRSALFVQASVECMLGIVSAKGGKPMFLGVDVGKALDGLLDRLRGIDVFGHFGGALCGLIYCMIV